MDTSQILDYSEEKVNYQIASKEKRFLNYIVDRIVTFVMLIFLFGIFLDEAQLEAIEDMNRIVEYLLGAAMTVTYYSLFEGLGNGKSIGKLLTGTRAVSISNEKLDFTSVLARSFSRIVPFEPLSFLGSSKDGWHDDWSKSKVIDERKPSSVA